jgi:hypothetical protein
MLTAPARAPSAHTTDESKDVSARTPVRTQERTKETRTLGPIAAPFGPDFQVEAHRAAEVRAGEPHGVVPGAGREDMDNGGADGGVAVGVEAEDHIADLGVRGRHPHRAGGVEVLEDLEGAEEDVGLAPPARGGGGSGGSGDGDGGIRTGIRAGAGAGGGGGGCAEGLEGKGEDMADWRGGGDV